VAIAQLQEPKTGVRAGARSERWPPVEWTAFGTDDDGPLIDAPRLAGVLADPDNAPPMSAVWMAPEARNGMMPSILAELPPLEAALPEIRAPVGFVHGARSAMPLGASTHSADRIPGAWVAVIDGAGHFIRFESPGSVRTALRRLTVG
jgi:pimeloyl-ACP methyl ester carboxylesterase